MKRGECADNIGEKVIYSTHPGEAEEGVIHSVNEVYVFVLYGRSQTPQATHPENLTLLRGGSVRAHIALGMADAGFSEVVTSCGRCLWDVYLDNGRWRLAGNGDDDSFDPWTCNGAADGRHSPAEAE